MMRSNDSGTRAKSGQPAFSSYLSFIEVKPIRV
jgi:hypothetical protein